MRAMIVYGRGIDANIRQLHHECKRLMDEVILARIADLSAYIGPDGSRFWHGYRQLKPIDICFVRSLGSGTHEQITRRLSLLEHMEKTGALVVNPVNAIRTARDKYATMTALAKAGLPIPETYVTEMAYWAYRKTGHLKQTVYKPLIGSLGFGSMKFSNKDMAFNVYAQLERIGQPLLIQEYIGIKEENGPISDLRAFVIGDRTVAAMERTAKQGQWKTNIAQGAKPKAIKLTNELEKLALKATKTLNLAYAGIDILQTEQKATILETNTTPNWQTIQKTAKTNIARQITEHMTKEWKSKTDSILEAI
jgi:ribosomal protein S6--L-glutamate ligase